MRSTVGSTLLVLALSASAAEAVAAQGWTAGFKAGTGRGAFTGATEFTWQPGVLTGALFFTRELAGPLAFQPELVYNQKLGESTVGPSSLTFTADYLVAPMLLRVDLARTAIRPYVLLGPSVVLQVNCNMRFVTSGLLADGDCENNQTANGQLNNFDLGFDGGVGVSVPLGFTALSVEARGFTSLRTEIVPLETSTSRSFGWSVMAGFSRAWGRPRGPAGTAPLPGIQMRAEAAPVPRVAPPLPAETLVEERSASAPAPAASAKLISVTAVNADVRPLLIGIAREAGIDLIVTPDVASRVSLNLKDVTAMEAIAAIAAAGELAVTLPRDRDLPAVVYYQLPVNVNKESAETIAARFGVSLELARYLVENRKN